MLASMMLAGLLAAQALPGKNKIEFAQDVEPILRTRCHACHGPQQQMNGLRLDRREDALRGSQAGPVIVPGSASRSKLIHLVSGLDEKRVMPPQGARLTAQEIGVLRAWIDQGAVWEAAQKRPHWAFQPVRRPAPPDVRHRSAVKNPIDNFVVARLEAEGMQPSPEAQPATLIRRLSLDLRGLPPTPAEVAQFLADRSANAYERLADRLLDSPHYGEKWARHWLDQARYADSDGYEKDNVRPHAWRWRHWVIDALNRDMPFDRFTVEQIAGDLLEGATVEQKIATGFHRNTLTNREGGVNIEQFRFEQIVDRANTVSSVWLGLTAGCAQCHDHKYDPIAQKQYYQLFAFFNTAEEVNIDAPLAGEMGPYLQALPEYRKKRAELLAQYGVPELQPTWEQKMLLAAANPGKWTDWDHAYDAMQKLLDGADRILRTDPARRTQRQTDALASHFVGNFHRVISKEFRQKLNFEELRKKLSELDASFPALSEAPTIAADAEPRATHIAIRGDWRSKGPEVQPGAFSFLHPLPADSKPTRLTLARWLVSRENPLTSRVMVNRMWQEFFGRGLVRTSEDFGAQGEKPSHPELLDWLAAEFIDRGWSMKRMHKLIVMSAAYRQSSRTRPELESRDPANTLLARQSRLRLPAETVRDSALTASELLYPAIGGKSVRPPQPEGVAELGYANSVKWQASPGRERYRRGLYIHFQRTTPYPQLMNFDAPDSNVTACRRERSNTPLQALNLLNDPVFVEAAQALAARVLREAPAGFAERAQLAFELCLTRQPTAKESEWLAEYYRQQTQILEKEPKAADTLFPVPPPGVSRIEAAAWMGLGSVLLNLDEFITRE